MTPTRAWVLLKSGRRINLLDPQPDSWDDSDLAIGLSRTYPGGGININGRDCPRSFIRAFN